MTKDPWKDFAPDDFIRNPATVPTKVPTPGKTTRTDGYTGDSAYDREPYCEREPGAPGCSLLDRPRNELIFAIGRRVVTIATNQKIAVMKCERDILAEKPKDLELLPTAFLAVMGIVMGNTITSLAMEAAKALDTAPQVFNVAAVSRIPIVYYSYKATNAWKAQIANAQTVNRDMKLRMLQHVESTVDTSMERLFEHAKQGLNDDELQALVGGLDPAGHTPQLYYDALTSMLKRLSESGVRHIGRTWGPERENAGHRDPSVEREDTRVIWVPMGPDRPPVLFYQHVSASGPTGLAEDGSRLPERGTFGELAHEGGMNTLRLEKPILGKPVETEFVSTAIAAHIANWGPIVPSTLNPTTIAEARAKLGIGGAS